MRKKYIRGKECPKCGSCFIKTKDNIVWFCVSCKAEGRIKDLYGTGNPEEKVELSEEWKKLTGEK